MHKPMWRMMLAPWDTLPASTWLQRRQGARGLPCSGAGRAVVRQRAGRRRARGAGGAGSLPWGGNRAADGGGGGFARSCCCRGPQRSPPLRGQALHRQGTILCALKWADV